MISRDRISSAVFYDIIKSAAVANDGSATRNKLFTAWQTLTLSLCMCMCVCVCVNVFFFQVREKSRGTWNTRILIVGAGAVLTAGPVRANAIDHLATDERRRSASVSIRLNKRYS